MKARYERPDIADEFSDLFGEIEHAMRNCGFCKPIDRVEADWDALARNLAAAFLR